MTTEKLQQLNDIFDELAEQLNITPTMHDKAVSSYGYVGKWLGGGNLNVDIYPQGSFSLGTVIRPVSGNDDGYDIDLVCLMPDYADENAGRIKQAVGKRIKENNRLSDKLEPEGNRCWTLEYDGFHMDILPCVPDENSKTFQYSGNEIRLTHRLATELYEDRYSNPKGYQKWFEDRMESTLFQEKTKMARAQNRSVEEVKTYETRTSLQKAIQILKQHRNIMFENMEDAPVSIMITTLAALSYRGEVGTYEALSGIIGRMRSYIEYIDGRYSLKNPVDPREDFTDKWTENPKKEENFFKWLGRVERDFQESAFGLEGMDEIGLALNKSVGQTMSKRTLNSYASNVNEARNKGALFAGATGLSTVGSVDVTPVPKHSFYGEMIG